MRFKDLLNEGKALSFLKKDAEIVFRIMKTELHARFKNGQATCTFACWMFIKKCDEDILPDCEIVSGDYDRQGHWWVLYHSPDGGDYIVDLGNNIEDSAIKTGIITPKIIKYPNRKYKIEDIMSTFEYQNYYYSIRNY
jgi:hypothetical protein